MNNKIVESVESNNEKIETTCPYCKSNLFEVGIVEQTVGGISTMRIDFKDGKEIHGPTLIEEIDEQWSLCGKCKKQMDYAAHEIIDELFRQNKITVDTKICRGE